MAESTLKESRTFGACSTRSKGTYVAVEPFHMDSYVDEQVFRYNNRRNKTDAQRFH